MNSKRALILTLLAAFAAVNCNDGPITAEETWPSFRGSDGSGLPAASGLPNSWSKDENIGWVNEVPGRGWSSPIVWGSRVFVTSAVSEGEFKEPSKGIFGNDYIAELQSQGLSMEEAAKKTFERDLEPTGDDSAPVTRLLTAFDTSNGETVWQKQVHRGPVPGGRHRKNTFASETPITDGERVYVLVGNVGVYAFSMDGEQLWEHPLEPRQIYLNFGTASSPAQDDEHLYVQNDNDEECYLKALDKSTGEQVWEVIRCKAGEERRGFTSGWSSPYVWRNDLRTEIVAIGVGHAISYDQEGNSLVSEAG